MRNTDALYHSGKLCVHVFHLGIKTAAAILGMKEDKRKK
jgi:hypothetical protein